MKPYLILVGVVLLSLQTLSAQTAPAATSTASTPTVVTSDQFKMDMAAKQGFFVGNVVVVGSDFKLKSRDMQVFFDENNKIKRMIARGNVETEQPNRTTKSGQAEYLVAENKIILTETPQVLQDRNTVTGNIITIYRDSNRMDVDGRSRVLLYPSDTASASTPATPAK